MPKQEFAQAMPRLQLVLLAGLAIPRQVSQRPLLRARPGYCGSLSCTMAASKLLGVAVVGLDSLAGFGGRQTGGEDFARPFHLRHLPIQAVAGGAGLLARADLALFPPLVHQLADRPGPIGDRAQALEFSAPPTFDSCGSAALWAFQTRQRSPRLRSRGGCFILTSPAGPCGATSRSRARHSFASLTRDLAGHRTVGGWRYRALGQIWNRRLLL